MFTELQRGFRPGCWHQEVGDLGKDLSSHTHTYTRRYISVTLYTYLYLKYTHFRLPLLCNVTTFLFNEMEEMMAVFLKPHQFSKAAVATEVRLHWNVGFQASTTLKTWLISPNP